MDVARDRGSPSTGSAGGFLLRLLFRFALVIVALIAMAAVALYAFAHVLD